MRASTKTSFYVEIDTTRAGKQAALDLARQQHEQDTASLRRPHRLHVHLRYPDGCTSDVVLIYPWVNDAG